MFSIAHCCKDEVDLFDTRQFPALKTWLRLFQICIWQCNYADMVRRTIIRCTWSTKRNTFSYTIADILLKQYAASNYCSMAYWLDQP